MYTTQDLCTSSMATVRGLAHGMIHEPSMIHIMSTMQSHYSVDMLTFAPIMHTQLFIATIWKRG